MSRAIPTHINAAAGIAFSGSLARAESIKRALIDKFKFDPNKFSIAGKGWDVPADAAAPDNHALNRRVEISVFPPEQK